MAWAYRCCCCGCACCCCCCCCCGCTCCCCCCCACGCGCCCDCNGGCPSRCCDGGCRCWRRCCRRRASARISENCQTRPSTPQNTCNGAWVVATFVQMFRSTPRSFSKGHLPGLQAYRLLQAQPQPPSRSLPIIPPDGSSTLANTPVVCRNLQPASVSCLFEVPWRLVGGAAALVACSSRLGGGCAQSRPSCGIQTCRTTGECGGVCRRRHSTAQHGMAHIGAVLPRLPCTYWAEPPCQDASKCQ